MQQHEASRPGPAFRATAWLGVIVVGGLVAAALFCAGWALTALVLG